MCMTPMPWGWYGENVFDVLGCNLVLVIFVHV